ncbi:MAG: carboxypeptidase-like regulatory domain-containing protein [Acidimicrobiales bacterium]
MLLVLGALALTAACSNDHQSRPRPTPDPRSTTTVVDRSGIALAGVPGQTTTTILEHGTATLTGSVRGPGGLVVGATVRIERLVAGRVVRSDVLTGPDGRFLLGGVPGGGYRVRAFLAPSLAQVKPEIRFLDDGKEHSFDLAVEKQSGLVVRADVAPEPPLLGKAVNLVASVAERSVSADGIVRSTPVVGVTVELAGLGRWVLREDTSSTDGGSASSTSTSVGVRSSTTTSTTVRTGTAPSAMARTDGSGQVRYELRCHTAGAPGLVLRVPVTVMPAPDATGATGPPSTITESVELDLPDCIDPATTTTTTSPTTSTSASSTTRP